MKFINYSGSLLKKELFFILITLIKLITLLNPQFPILLHLLFGSTILFKDIQNFKRVYNFNFIIF